AMMQNQGLLIANDNRIDRMKPLVYNLERCGISNALITLMEGRYFANTNLEFDKILVDAPCSGIGTIRKSLKTIQIWNPEFSRKMCGLQKQLVKIAFNKLKVGGTLVYSTCTLEPDENEGVVDFILNEFDNAKVENFDFDIKRGKPIEEFKGKSYSSEVKKTLRIWPQDNDTEGFYVAKIKKC
ncbi:MAG: RsmB/NOP family class I SAM-dependent RNA methyltransferase, partial [Nanoarchaeota archaeon]|nr:RsmB/NOP family class I SAM-dependent RNA methyltransferase [Nanoarchaeota archaeon]